MALDFEQFKKLRQQGITVQQMVDAQNQQERLNNPNAINATQPDENGVPFYKKAFDVAKNVAGFFAKPVITSLARPAQLAGQLTGETITGKATQQISQNNQSLGMIAQNFLKLANEETDPNKKRELLLNAANTVHGMRVGDKLTSDLQDQIEQAKSTIAEPLNTDQPLSNIAQQVTGTAIGTAALGVSSPATAGALLMGSGALESGADITTLPGALETGGKTLLGLFGGKALEKVSSPILKKIASTQTGGAIFDGLQKVGSHIANFLDASPNVLPQGFTKVVTAGEKAVSNVGETAATLGLNKLYSPEKQIQRVQNWWETARSKYPNIEKGELLNDKNSPAFLTKEGILPQGSGGQLQTFDQAMAVKTKAIAESKVVDDLLEKTNKYSSIDKAQREAIANISKNIKGSEQQKAIRAIQADFDAFRRQYASKIVEGKSGEELIPAIDMNDIKSYFWENGYSNSIQPKSDQLVARASRLAGNSVKNEVVNSVGGKEGKVLNDLNNRIGELYNASDFLLRLHGKPLPFGRIGKYFASTIGSVVGAPLGPVGSIAGAITADRLVSIMQNPKFTVGQTAYYASKATPEVVAQAQEIIQKSIQDRTTRLVLPSPSVIGSASNPFITPAPTTFEKQAKQINYTK